VKTPTVNITPTRAALLRAVEAGHVYRQSWFPYESTNGQTRRRVSAAIDPLWSAKLVDLDKSRAERWRTPYVLTEAGAAALAEYAAGGAS
jgi:hypothetical protein